MSAIEPAGDKIVRNLQESLEALRRDISRVELWAGALGTFAKPIPDYGHGQTRFDLRPEPAAASHARPQSHPRDTELDDERNRRDRPRRAAGSTIDTAMLGMANGAPQRD